MAQFIKDFGPILGPFLGFVFTVLAILLKEWLERRWAVEKAREQFNTVIHLIEVFEPVPGVYPEAVNIQQFSNSESIDMGRVNNRLNVFRAASALRIIETRLGKVAADIERYGEPEEITRVHGISWCVKTLLERLDAIEARAADHSARVLDPLEWKMQRALCDTLKSSTKDSSWFYKYMAAPEMQVPEVMSIKRAHP